MNSAAGKEPRALLLFVAALLVPAVLGSSKTIFNDGDVSWHIATGLWILHHHSIPNFDPFSFTWAGKPWVPIEWLAEVVYGFAFRSFGYAGIAALVTAALIALHAFVYFSATRFIRASAALGAVLLMDVALIPMLLARPHLLSWPLFAFWTWLMLKARAEDRAPSLGTALLMTLWANLHGGFVFGLFLAGMFGLEALVQSDDKRRAFQQWLVFGLACIIAIFINGNGITGVLQPLKFTHLQMLPLIDEWKPSNPRVTPFFFVVLSITLVLMAWKRPKLSWVRWLLLGTFLGLALIQVRHQAMFAILAAMVLPTGFGQGGRERLALDRPLKLALWASAALLVAARTQMPREPSENEANPWKLIAKITANLRSKPVLNGYSMGGPLILSGIRPYVDGRGDMYGDELILGYARIVHGDPKAFSFAVTRWNIRWAILPNESKKLIQVIDHSPGWHRIISDEVGVIYVRTS